MNIVLNNSEIIYPIYYYIIIIFSLLFITNYVYNKIKNIYYDIYKKKVSIGTQTHENKMKLEYICSDLNKKDYLEGKKQ